MTLPAARVGCCSTGPCNSKHAGQEYRSLKLYGQEINLITSAIARMNMFMHGIEEFQIIRGDTLAEPGLLENDELKTFNVILANPPYSIKAWNRNAFAADPYGRNLWGTPPQGCADYAFQQHIQKSLDRTNGRCISLWPHGVLFRDSEADMRRQMIAHDLVDCVIGLGPNLFYNSPMESCLLICRTSKPTERRGKILFINAVGEIRTEKTTSQLDETNIQRIAQAYHGFADIDGFAKVVPIEEVLANKANLSMARYVSNVQKAVGERVPLESIIETWAAQSDSLRQSVATLLTELSE